MDTISGNPVNRKCTRDPISVFLRVRRSELSAQPEEMLAWIRAKLPEHDGRIYARISEVKQRFERTDAFYLVISALAREGLIEVERWKLERLGPKKPKTNPYRNAPSPWDTIEHLYVVRAIDLEHPIEFECYARTIVRPSLLTKEERHQLWAEAGGICSYCCRQIEFIEMAIDHDVPRSRGGGNNLSNLVASCINCNTSKGPLTGEEYSRILAREGVI